MEHQNSKKQQGYIRNSRSMSALNSIGPSKKTGSATSHKQAPASSVSVSRQSAQSMKSTQSRVLSTGSTTSSTKPGSSKKSRTSTSRKSSPKTACTLGLHRSMAATGFAPQGQTKELVYKVVDYLDWATINGKVMQYTVGNKQGFLGEIVGPLTISEAPFTKLIDISCWALPRAVNAEVSTSTYQALYSTPVLPAVATQFDATTTEVSVLQASQRATTVNPTFNTKWVQVGYTNFDRLARGGLLPVSPTVAQDSTVAFSLSLLDPDNGQALPEDIGPQLMVVATFAQTLPLNSAIRASIDYGTSFTDINGNGTLQSQYAMVELLRLQDAV